MINRSGCRARNAFLARRSAAAPYASTRSGDKILRLILVLEAVYEIFGGNWLAGSRAVSEQVTDRIVVLAMGQAPNGDLRDGTPFFRLFFAVAQRLREFLALQSSVKSLDPGLQSSFFRDCPGDALSACVGDPIRRLLEQQRFVRPSLG